MAPTKTFTVALTAQQMPLLTMSIRRSLRELIINLVTGSNWSGTVRASQLHVLGDPGADSGGEGKSKRAGKYGTKKSFSEDESANAAASCADLGQ